MINNFCKDLGNSPSVIRELFEYGKQRKQQIGVVYKKEDIKKICKILEDKQKQALFYAPVFSFLFYSISLFSK